MVNNLSSCHHHSPIFINTGHRITCSTECLDTPVSLSAGQDNASERVIILAAAEEAPVLPQGGAGAAPGEDILTPGDRRVIMT